MTRMHGPRWGAAPGLLAVAALVAACGGTTTPPTPTRGATSTPVPTASTPSSPAVTTLPVVTAAPATVAPTPIAGFATASVTFVSSQDGWVLGTVGGHLALARTQNGGTSWTSVTPPPTTFLTLAGGSGVDGVRFADQQDGWAYGSQLWATHNGGISWTQIALPGLNSSTGSVPIQGLETAAGTVNAVYYGAGGFDIASSPTGSNAWAVSPTTIAYGAGPIPQAQLVIQGSAGWVVEDDRVVAGGARLQSGAWSAWTAPCTAANGPATLAGSSSTDLIAVCEVGLYGGSSTPTEQAFASTNGGGAFTGLATALPVACQGVPSLASPTTSVAAAGCGGEIVATFNGGESWGTVFTGAGNTSIAYVGFTTPTQGVAIEVSLTSSTGLLLMTHDGGHTWAAVTI
ncbi:MAG: hypothetical protein ABR950_08395 [Candidatus Dormibacteria bacterium]|jgi:hypothetical protein